MSGAIWGLGRAEKRWLEKTEVSIGLRPQLKVTTYGLRVDIVYRGPESRL